MSELRSYMQEAHVKESRMYCTKSQRPVWFSQVMLPNRFPINGSFSTRTGLHNVMLTDMRLPHLHTLQPTPGPSVVPSEQSLPREPWHRVRASEQDHGPSGPSTHWRCCPAKHWGPNPTAQPKWLPALIPMGFAMSKVQQNQLGNFSNLNSTYSWYKLKHNSRVQGVLKKYTQRSTFQ